jgi:hypothetical protein
MLHAGQRVILKRLRQTPAVVAVHHRDRRGFWVGKQVIDGTAHPTALRAFKTGEVLTAYENPTKSKEIG